MDFPLRCNSLKCRAQLNERAVVTTCSHIFCLACTEGLGLASAPSLQRICPACGTTLNSPDDVVSTQLNPTEDYKTSILSGLSPTIITECAGRALAFWSYQSSQEIIYQEFLAKSLTEKYGNLNVQLDKIINDANAEIENLNQRIANMQMEQDKLKAENLNVMANLREKTRKQQQTQELYERLKRKEMAAATQSAAFDSADELLHSAQRQEDGSQVYPPGMYRGNLTFQNELQGSVCGRGTSRPGPIGTPPPRKVMTDFGGQGIRIHNDSTATSQHRQRLGSSVAVTGSTLRHPAQHIGFGTSQAGSARRPLSTVSGNVPSRLGGNPGFGMTAGMKKGAPQSSRLSQYENAYDGGGYVDRQTI